jgi:hypothetical protein
MTEETAQSVASRCYRLDGTASCQRKTNFLGSQFIVSAPHFRLPETCDLWDKYVPDFRNMNANDSNG